MAGGGKIEKTRLQKRAFEISHNLLDGPAIITDRVHFQTGRFDAIKARRHETNYLSSPCLDAPGDMGFLGGFLSRLGLSSMKR